MGHYFLDTQYFCSNELFYDRMLHDRYDDKYIFRITMVLILDGDSETGVHVMSDICYLTFLMHQIRSRAFTNRCFLTKKTFM